MESATKYLTIEEIKFLEIGQLKSEARRMNVAIMERDMALCSLRAELEREKATVIKHRLYIMKQEHLEAAEAHTLAFKALKEKYMVPEGANFGFNPESGEIKIDLPQEIK